jgi:hypothetical protein
MPLFATRGVVALFATRPVEMLGATELLVFLYNEVLHLIHLHYTYITFDTSVLAIMCVDSALLREVQSAPTSCRIACEIVKVARRIQKQLGHDFHSSLPIFRCYGTSNIPLAML